MTESHINVKLGLSVGDDLGILGTETEDLDCLMMARVFDVVLGYEPSRTSR